MEISNSFEISQDLKEHRDSVLSALKDLHEDGLIHRGDKFADGFQWSIKPITLKNEKILDAIEKKGTISKKEISEVSKIDFNSVDDALRQLLKTGALTMRQELVNGRKVNFYSIKDKILGMESKKLPVVTRSQDRHDLSDYFKGSPWQGMEYLVKMQDKK
ncbi:MAG: hypothetical protein ACO24I_05430 [Candidatus Fonsibacter ubiquis]